MERWLAWAAFALFVLLIVVALLMARSDPAHLLIAGGAAALLSGETAHSPGAQAGTPHAETFCGGAVPEEDESLHGALASHALSLGPSSLVAVHPLNRDEYTSGEKDGGGRVKRAWTEFASWAELRKDPVALRAYMAARAEAQKHPDHDWGPVLREVLPLLQEDREYIGLVNLGGDGRTLTLAALEASPTRAGTLAASQGFAEVPGDLVARVARRPALYLFHTHVADPRSSPLPSAHDLATAVRLAAAAQYAGSAVVSRYGVFVYGLDWAGYAAIHRAPRWHEAARNVSHDVAAALTAVRSWGPHTLAEFLALFTRLRLSLFVYPSPAMVADTGRLQEVGLDSPADYTLLAALGREAESLRARQASGHKAAHARRAVDVDYGLDAASASTEA